MTTISIIIISILSVLTLILGYTTYNLLRKVEKSEDLIIKYDNYITEFSKQIEASDKRLNEIDMKGMFNKKWLFIGLLAVGAVGCSDLEVENLNNPDTSKVLASDADVKTLASGMYNQFHRGVFWYNGIGLALVLDTLLSKSLSTISLTIHPALLIKTEPSKNKII